MSTLLALVISLMTICMTTTPPTGNIKIINFSHSTKWYYAANVNDVATGNTITKFEILTTNNTWFNCTKQTWAWTCSVDIEIDIPFSVRLTSDSISITGHNTITSFLDKVVFDLGSNFDSKTTPKTTLNPSQTISETPTNSKIINCISSCAGIADNNYQSCSGCEYYITCNNGELFDNRACPTGLQWDDNGKSCTHKSTTCTTSSDNSNPMPIHNTAIKQTYTWNNSSAIDIANPSQTGTDSSSTSNAMFAIVLITGVVIISVGFMVFYLCTKCRKAMAEKRKTQRQNNELRINECETNVPITDCVNESSVMQLKPGAGSLQPTQSYSTVSNDKNIHCGVFYDACGVLYENNLNGIQEEIDFDNTETTTSTQYID